MLIDWFTVGAQVINFLIMVWLLKHFLYKPILDAIAARDKHVATELAAADTKRSEAQKEKDDFQNKNKALDEQRDALLSKATDDARAERERLLDAARKDGDSLRAQQDTALRQDQVRLSTEITRAATQQVFAVVRKTLADLATTSLEERIGDVFVRRVGALDDDARAALAVALKIPGEPVRVRSTFELPDETRAAIQTALNEVASAHLKVSFETVPDTLAGIELTVQGQKVAWSIEDYLKSLKATVDALLDAQAAPTPTPQATDATPQPAPPTPPPEAAPEPKVVAGVKGP